ncbi:MAG: trehalose-6-phosphate synthase [Alphaproteobacteria bacterium]|nr:trehalose-6-phosphate synthase [Alphaproteobacteria bacterium]
MARVVVISNRVPVPTELGPRAGGLVVGVKDAIKDGGLWFGWSGQVAEHTGGQPHLNRAGNVDYATVEISKEDYERFYVGFTNGTLWPLLHFRPGLVAFERVEFESYLSVNRAFAKSLLPLLKPDDLIWVHDYHLIPMATELRALGVKNRIGFFLHVPFVPPSLLDALPQARRLLRMMCDYDAVGFQTAQHLRDFQDCLRSMLGLVAVPGIGIQTDGHAMMPIAAPIGIDARAFARQAKRAASAKATQRLVDSLVGRSLIIGVDRLDYSKGLPNRFVAFSRLLEEHKEHRLKVSYLQVAPRSREDVAEYQRLKRDLDRRTGEINGRFAEFDWVPLRYLTRPIARASLAGFYRVARVGLVTPLRDGMNLVAKEYVAAQDPEDPGVLVLSRFAGAAEELDDAIIINPNDSDEITEAMHQALTMPLAERKARYESLFEKVCRTTAQSYCKDFLGTLTRQVPDLDIRESGMTADHAQHQH